MVYRGRPSSGCEGCRKRKVKCDEATPQCGQCLKAKHECPGYRAYSQLIFLNENTTAARKSMHQNKNNQVPRESKCSPSKPPTVSRPTTRSSLFPSEIVSSQEPITEVCPSSPHKGLSRYVQPAPYVDDLATEFFYAHFVVSGYLAWLPKLGTQGKLDPALENAILCVGMTGFANTFGSQVESRLARQKYVKALERTNANLRDYIKSREDQTLVAVFLLGLFETIACTGSDDLNSWKKHIEGASAILRLRGPEQLQSQEGLILFRQLRSLIVINCLWNETSVPHHIAEWLGDHQQLQDPIQLPSDRLADICVTLANLRSGIQRGRLTDSRSIIDRLRNVEADLVSWAMTTPIEYPTWEYYCVFDSTANQDEVWKGMYHVYGGPFMSMIWNYYRGTRILVNSLLSLRFSDLGYLPTSAEQLQIDVIQSEMVDEICAGTPWRLGCPHEKSAWSNLNPVPLIGGYAIIWPLFMAGDVVSGQADGRTLSSPSSVPDGIDLEMAPHTQTRLPVNSHCPWHQMRWIMGRLRYIARVMGVRQADVFAEVLVNKLNSQLKLHT